MAKYSTKNTPLPDSLASTYRETLQFSVPKKNPDPIIGSGPVYYGESFYFTKFARNKRLALDLTNQRVKVPINNIDFFCD
jgi:hypothetical protein